MALTEAAIAIIGYFIAVFLLYKFFEKFFKIVFFLLTALVVAALFYFMVKGG
jgi:hypothetical protein